MIEVRRLTLAYDDQPVLDDVQLWLADDELMLVSGPTGVGKSSLLGVVAGLVPRFTGGTLTGDLLLDGESILQLPARERAHLIGYVGQDPARGFVTDTVEEELAFGMEQLGVGHQTMRRRVEETLDLLGIADLRSRELRTLSGGQQQRVAIGAVLTMHPRLVVLDEPTSALDPTAAEDVLATITRLVHDLGISVLLAEHRLERVIPFADSMALFVGDGTLDVGSAAEILGRSPVVPPIVELGRRAHWDPLPLTVREARRRARDLSLGPAVPQDRLSSAADATGGLRATRVGVVHGRTPAVREVSLDVPLGRVVTLMGRNGAGKSSLLWALQGSAPRASGTVDVGGRDPSRMTPAERRRSVGLVPQQASDLLYLETVAAELVAADQAADRPEGTTRAILDALVADIPDDRHPRDLSEGQRLALVLAIVLAAEPTIVMLDEPTRGLDYAAKRQLADHLATLKASGHGVLLSTHDVEFVALVADDVVVLAQGEVVSAGPVREVVAESPGFAPQVTKILGAPWLTAEEVPL